jgi:peptidoglycan/xylan/chitin deacetylase (PgdA/CDA1 family)
VGYWPDGKRAAVSLTFDDARPSQVDNGLALLDGHGIRASFYVSPSNLMERRDGWKKAVAAGHELGNHTMHHPCTGHYKWSREHAIENMTLATMENEIVTANAVILHLTGYKALTFGYPCDQTWVGRGAAVQSYVPLVAKHFICGRGGMPEGTPVDPEWLDLALVPCVGSDGRSLDELKTAVERAVEAGSWLVPCGHEIGNPGFQVTDAGVLDAFCGWLKGRNDILVGTVAEVAGIIREKRGNKG